MTEHLATAGYVLSPVCNRVRGSDSIADWTQESGTMGTSGTGGFGGGKMGGFGGQNGGNTPDMNGQNGGFGGGRR